MIEKTIISYLNTKLSVNVYAEEPESAETSYVVIERTSGSVTDYFSTATIAVRSYGASMVDAAELNEDVKAALASLPYDNAKISKVQLNSDYNYTDTTKKKYRYQAVFDIWYFND